MHARMRLNAEAAEVGEELPTGADLESIAFSLAIIPSLAHLWVHWVEIKSTPPENHGESMKWGDHKVQSVAYHMNLVGSYDFQSWHRDDFALLRRDIESVLDWGTPKRKHEVKNVLKRIASKLEQEKGDDAPRPAKKKPKIGR